jgi:hypothetical protein
MIAAQRYKKYSNALSLNDLLFFIRKMLSLRDYSGRKLIYIENNLNDEKDF